MQSDKNYVLGMARHSLWILSRELPNEVASFLEIECVAQAFPIDWYGDKNEFLEQILPGYNLIKNGDFGGIEQKSLSGWKISAEEASAGVDLSEEWQLSTGHTAFLLAADDAARPSLNLDYKVPVIGNGEVQYKFSGLFATHRAGGAVKIEYFDESDGKIGDELIDVLHDPAYGGGASLTSYNHVNIQFLPIKGAHYIHFKIELGEQVDFSQSNACLFFTQLFLGVVSEKSGDVTNALSSGILSLSSLIVNSNWLRYGLIKLESTKMDDITVKYNGVSQQINLFDERKSLLNIAFHEQYESVCLLVKKNKLRVAKNQCLIALKSNFSIEQKELFNGLLIEIKKNNVKGESLEADIIERSGLFDEVFYIENNQDLGEAEIDLLEHFVHFGWKENRDPNQYFSLEWYAKRYNLDENVNPLLHYINVGWMQLFDTSKYFCTQQYLNAYKSELFHYVIPLAYFINIGCQLGHQTFKVPFSAGVFKQAKKNSISPVPDDLDLYAKFQGKLDYKSTSQSFNPKKLTIHWIVPDFSAGSGGHMTIFRMINYLEQFGHQNTIWITGKQHNKTEELAYESIVKNFQFVAADVKFFGAEFYNIEADAVIATGWNTVWGALGSSKIKRAFYFVQDFEPKFYATGARAIVAEETYHQDIDCICASPWLAQIMTDKYQRWATSFLLSYDNKNYYINEQEQTSLNTSEIAVYYRPFTDRRAVELVLMGLQELAIHLTHFRVHFFGNHEPISFDSPFDYIDHGTLTAEQLGELYRACDVGVTFSATNYSLIPQEMMACGLPVVELDTDCCRMVFPKGTVTLTKPHPRSISSSIIRLIKDKTLAAKQIHAAQQWIGGFSWETAAKTVESAIIERLENFNFKKQKQVVKKDKKPDISVVIPTYNGGEHFKTVLQQVLVQQLPWTFEVVVIDSSSNDGTAEFLQSQSGIILHHIPKQEFQHGRTRNLGAELAQGSYIAFITQDALPTSEYWLYYLIASLKKHPKAAGVFGKHLPYDHASPFMKRDLSSHFKGFDQHALCVSKYLDQQRYDQGDQEWHQFLRFYSDNNSAMRKSVWQQIPYPEINFGEDQAWAKKIIDAGYEKIYSPHGSVYHSHNYEYKEQFMRAYEEYTFFKEEFCLMIDSVNSDILQSEIDALDHKDVTYANSHNVDISKAELQQQLSLNKAFVLGKYAVYIADLFGGVSEKRSILEDLLSD